MKLKYKTILDLGIIGLLILASFVAFQMSNPFDNELIVFDGSNGMISIIESVGAEEFDYAWNKHIESEQGKNYMNCLDEEKDLCYTNLSVGGGNTVK